MFGARRGFAGVRAEGGRVGGWEVGRKGGRWLDELMVGPCIEACASCAGGATSSYGVCGHPKSLGVL